MNTRVALTLFNGRAGDHNDHAMTGGPLLAAGLQARLGTDIVTVGSPEPCLATNWDIELGAAMPSLRAMAARYEQVYATGAVPVTALSRCAVALATLPVVARHHPDAVVVWFDAHADLNTPDTTLTGYLGGLALSGAAGLWDSGLGGDLAIGNVVLGGARDLDPFEQELVDEGTVQLVPVGDHIATRLQEATSDRPVYFHLDCDVLEPGIVPTDYTVPGGLSLADLHDVAEVLAASDVVGVELGEFEGVWEPGREPASATALLNALEPLLSATGRA